MYSPADIEKSLEEHRKRQSPFTMPQMGWWPALGEREKGHPFWHYCRLCMTFAKTVAIFFLLQLVIEFATFKPIHELYEHMGWLK